jgi:hypothetical protein
MVNSIQPRDFENAISITDVTYYDVWGINARFYKYLIRW